MGKNIFSCKLKDVLNFVVSNHFLLTRESLCAKSFLCMTTLLTRNLYNGFNLSTSSHYIPVETKLAILILWSL